MTFSGLPSPAGSEQVKQHRLFYKILRPESGMIVLVLVPMLFLFLSLAGVINGEVRFIPPVIPTLFHSKCDTFLAQLTREYGDYQIGVPYGTGNVQVLATYGVGQNDTLTPLITFSVIDSYEPYQSDIKSHQDIWNLYIYMIPSDNRPLLVEFDIVTDGQRSFLADISSNSDRNQFTLRVDIIDAVDKRRLTSTLLHEYAHYLTLNHTQLDLNQLRRSTCETYSCAKNDSYLAAFFQEFWTGIYKDWEEGDHFFEKYHLQFVSYYAASSPKEDIAETWTHFVLRTQPTSILRSSRRRSNSFTSIRNW